MNQQELEAARDKKQAAAVLHRRKVDYWLAVVNVAYPALLRLAADGNADALEAVARVQLIPKP